MCLDIDLKKHPNAKPIVLTKPMIVYKYGAYMENRNVFVPLIMTFYSYRRFKETPTEKLQIEFDHSIRKGYHAYTIKKPMKPYYDRAKFLIPAYTRVFFGLDNDIVSERIIYLGPYIQTKYKKATLKKKLKYLFKYLIKNKIINTFLV